MARMIRRGPDASGLWQDPAGSAVLGFRRLSILDLTPAGNQPMIAADGRSVLVFNGEIYNHPELRRELESRGARFRSRADSEVLLAALNLWGSAALPRLNGMFALAWYNLSDRTLLLARDHAGIKPLYYAIQPGGSSIAFGSQFNILLDSPWNLSDQPQLDVLNLFLRLHHIPPPYGLLENTYQLEPGCFLEINAAGRIQINRWWQLPDHPAPDLTGSAAEEALAAALEAAVARQRVADVPLGTFLSGGIDSPLVTAELRRQTSPALKAFTIGSPGWGQDESEDAAAYARALQLDHRLHAVSPQDALNTIQTVIEAQHEPFGDFSILPTLLVSRIARQEVTVALSGDGGDELFFGYQRPLSLLKAGDLFQRPRWQRQGLYYAGRLGLAARRSEVIIAKDPGDYYFGVNSRMSAAHLHQIAPGLPGVPASFHLYDFHGIPDASGLANYSRRVEFTGQLQRCLKKVDMASMYHSLEVRVPLLDRAMIDTSLRIDPFANMLNGGRKMVLRALLAHRVPSVQVSPVKRGFAVPLGDWLRGSLRELAEDTLFARDLYPHNIFQPRALRNYWQEHIEKRQDHKWALWTMLSLQWWANYHLKAASHA